MKISDVCQEEMKTLAKLNSAGETEQSEVLIKKICYQMLKC